MAARKSTGTDVAPDTQLGERRLRGGQRREVLVVGELVPSLRTDLLERGARLTEVDDAHDGIVALAERPFDVVVVNPLATGRGVDFVTAIKEPEEAHQHTVATLYGARGDADFLRGVRPPPQEALEEARRRHRVTPFVVLPMGGETEYAVIVKPPGAAVMNPLNLYPVASVVMTVVPETLLKRVGALA